MERRLSLGRFAPEIGQALIAPTAEAVELVAHRIGLVVVLVVSLGGPERGGGGDLGGDRLLEALLELLLGGLGGLSLGVVVDEDRRAVLAADVAELAVRRHWIDVVPEDVEELLVG